MGRRTVLVHPAMWRSFGCPGSVASRHGRDTPGHDEGETTTRGRRPHSTRPALTPIATPRPLIEPGSPRYAALTPATNWFTSLASEAASRASSPAEARTCPAASPVVAAAWFTPAMLAVT